MRQIISEDMEEESLKTPSEHSSLVGLNDPPDEYFDVSEPLDYDQSETGWQSDYDQSRLGNSTWHIITMFQVIGSQLISEEANEITFPQYWVTITIDRWYHESLATIWISYNMFLKTDG